MDEITAQHRYLFNGHRELLTPDEAAAWRNLQVQRMIDLCEYPQVKELFRTRWLSKDPSVLKLLEQGAGPFLHNSLKRLESQVQRCPTCGALCRTSRARICPECSHSWFD
jgi:hypothetical protein